MISPIIWYDLDKQKQVFRNQAASKQATLSTENIMALVAQAIILKGGKTVVATLID